MSWNYSSKTSNELEANLELHNRTLNNLEKSFKRTGDKFDKLEWHPIERVKNTLKCREKVEKIPRQLLLQPQNKSKLE